MGEPPRLSEILLGQEQAVIYFVTLCVNERRAVLANQVVFEAIETTLMQLARWRVLAGVVMPDHFHLVISPAEARGLTIGDFATGFKRLLRKTLPEQHWEWQRGCFDRLLRSDESLHNKWTYIEDNPVRAGLVQKIEDWPFYLGSIAQQSSVGEAVSFPSCKIGKLTASP